MVMEKRQALEQTILLLASKLMASPGMEVRAGEVNFRKKTKSVYDYVSPEADIGSRGSLLIEIQLHV